SAFDQIVALIQLARLYSLSVRRASALPAASFRFHLTMDSLAVRLTIPPVGLVEDFHLQMSAPCREHRSKTPLPPSATTFFRTTSSRCSRSSFASRSLNSDRFIFLSG